MLDSLKGQKAHRAPPVGASTDGVGRRHQLGKTRVSSRGWPSAPNAAGP